MEFEEACSEMNYILEHMNPVDKNRIPQSVIEFFKTNRSYVYRVKLTKSKPLKEQKLKDETKAFIQIIYEKYLSDGTKNKEINKILKQSEKKKEVEEKELIPYKQNRVINWIRKIIEKRKRKKKY